MTKLTDLPSFTPGAPLRFINFVRYLTTPFHHVEWADGGATTFEDAAYFDDLVAGATLTVETTGSGEATPVSATFSAGPAPALTAVENGDPVDLEAFTLPVVDPAENLALSFDTSLDPARSFLLLIPIDRVAFPGARPAFIQPRSTTTRVVIPGGVLGELRSATAAGPVPFVLLVVDITVEEGVLSGTLLEDQSSFSLQRVQQGTTSMYLYVK